MFNVEEVMNAQRAKGPATILAIGTANPPECFDQRTFPDFYFGVTNSEHKTELKKKLQRLCDKSAIKKRYMHLTEDMLKRNPSMCEYAAPSLDVRQEILIVEVPKLGKEAAENAIKEWGQPKSQISHLIFSTSCGIDMPGADYQLMELLGLSPFVKRYMLYNTGCYAGGTGLRLAKDLAENNKGARILVVCCDMTAAIFRGPTDTNHDLLVAMSLFGDGAGASIVGSDPIPGVEKPMFEIVTATQTLVPDSGLAITGHIRESGLNVHLHKDVPTIISQNIHKTLEEAFKPLGGRVSDWNTLFWAVHPGGRAILDGLELELGLEPKKLRASRHVLREYGNMAGACIFFVLDEMRKKSYEEKLTASGEGLEWGVLLAFGPGLTVETLVLHSVST